MNTIEEQRAALERRLRAVETRSGYVGLGVRMFLGVRAYEVLGRMYRGIRRSST